MDGERADGQMDRHTDRQMAKGKNRDMQQTRPNDLVRGICI
jgi:hypothetical protein